MKFSLPSFDSLCQQTQACTRHDVELALSANSLSSKDLAALLSPAARPYLPQMAERSQKITQQRFGRVIQIYAPIYLSNFCTNSCAYCGFAAENKIKRHVLSIDEVGQEIDILAKRGFSHILLVSGEAPKKMGVDYLEEVARLMRDRFASVSIEVQPLGQEEYARLFAAGITSVAVYQETYDRNTYDIVHLDGKKCDYDFRLDTPARAAAEGMREVGIGALLGLSDWRAEGLALALHLAWLRKKFWRVGLTVSFPRLRPAEGNFKPLVQVNETDLSQLLFALRLFDHDVGLILSTREEAPYRDGMIGLGPTRYSAGSCTAPGGYAHPEVSGEQFEIDDDRTITEVCSAVRSKGFDPVRKDWDPVFQDH